MRSRNKLMTLLSSSIHNVRILYKAHILNSEVLLVSVNKKVMVIEANVNVRCCSRVQIAFESELL